MVYCGADESKPRIPSQTEQKTDELSSLDIEIRSRKCNLLQLPPDAMCEAGVHQIAVGNNGNDSLIFHGNYLSSLPAIILWLLILHNRLL